MNTDLMDRLKSYIAKMEPHQKEHVRGRLLIEAYEALKEQEAAKLLVVEEVEG
jgi:hypothetical protein